MRIGDGKRRAAREPVLKLCEGDEWPPPHEPRDRGVDYQALANIEVAAVQSANFDSGNSLPSPLLLRTCHYPHLPTVRISRLTDEAIAGRQVCQSCQPRGNALGLSAEIGDAGQRPASFAQPPALVGAMNDAPLQGLGRSGR